LNNSLPDNFKETKNCFSIRDISQYQSKPVSIEQTASRWQYCAEDTAGLPIEGEA
jgi:hypothetical protein